jgi:polysaccharide biosynthesis acetyltransferase WcbI-like protein
MPERWVVISNCQTFGLASSIQSLAKDIECIACDYWAFLQRIAEDPDYFRDFDLAVVLPDVLDRLQETPVPFPPTVTVPAFQFRAYQPDCVYVLAEGQELSGHVGPYHSMIALAAHKEGLGAERAAAFFNTDIFTAGGYLDSWVPARDNLVEGFRAHGLDIASVFVRRSRGRCFMHTINHPKIEILFDIAQALLVKLGRPIHANATLPVDALTGTIWPVYPAIGEQLGVRGSYLFHAPNDPRPLELVPFLQKSFDLYSEWDKSRLRVWWYDQPRLIRIREAIRAAR